MHSTHIYYDKMYQHIPMKRAHFALKQKVGVPGTPGTPGVVGPAGFTIDTISQPQIRR